MTETDVASLRNISGARPSLGQPWPALAGPGKPLQELDKMEHAESRSPVEQRDKMEATRSLS